VLPHEGRRLGHEAAGRTARRAHAVSPHEVNFQQLGGLGAEVALGTGVSGLALVVDRSQVHDHVRPVLGPVPATDFRAEELAVRASNGRNARGIVGRLLDVTSLSAGCGLPVGSRLACSGELAGTNSPISQSPTPQQPLTRTIPSLPRGLLMESVPSGS